MVDVFQGIQEFFLGNQVRLALGPLPGCRSASLITLNEMSVCGVWFIVGWSHLRYPSAWSCLTEIWNRHWQPPLQPEDWQLSRTRVSSPDIMIPTKQSRLPLSSRTYPYRGYCRDHDLVRHWQHHWLIPLDPFVSDNPKIQNNRRRFAQRLTESSTGLPGREKIGIAKTVPKKKNAIVTVVRRIRDKRVNVQRRKDVEDRPEDSLTAPARVFIHTR